MGGRTVLRIQEHQVQVFHKVFGMLVMILLLQSILKRGKPSVSFRFYLTKPSQRTY